MRRFSSKSGAMWDSLFFQTLKDTAQNSQPVKATAQKRKENQPLIFARCQNRKNQELILQLTEAA
jgi:hypothetical protein